MIFYDQSRNATLAVGLLFAECKDREVSVGVKAGIIRSTVVSVMLINPPAPAYCDHEITTEAKELVLSFFTENLIMTCIMANKTQLSKYKGKEHGVDELKPEIINDSYQGKAQSEQCKRNNEFMRVVEGCCV